MSTVKPKSPEVESPAKVMSIDWSKADVEIIREGRKIILPAEPGPMSIDQGIEALKRLKADEETLLDTHEFIDSYYTDALVALNSAMKAKFGWASAVPTPGFFGPTPPVMLTIVTGPEVGEQVQVPWGSFKVPGIDNLIQTHMHKNEHGMPTLVISGKIRKREQKELRELANLAREFLKSESIYKGKAIRLKVASEGKINHDKPPEFIPTAYLRPEDLVLNQDETDQVEVNIWALIRNTEACLRHNIPLKRGVLLEGPYGTGKTMIATVTSGIAVDNNWTFITLDNVSAIKDALLFAKRYEPCVLFAEDVERIAGARDEKGNDLLNTIDGILGKNSKVLVVFTTNHVEKLERAMLRPGRLDAVISVKAPDADAVQRLFRIYGRDLLDSAEDLTEVGAYVQGNIPATIREICERAKLAMVARSGLRITAKDLLISAKGMSNHMDLLKDKPPVETLGEELLGAIQKSVREGMAPAIAPMAANVQTILNHHE